MYSHGSTHGRAHVERPEDSLDCYHTHHPSLSTASVLWFFCFLLPSPWRSSEITDAHYLGPHTWLVYTLIHLPAFLTIVFTLRGHLRPLCELPVQFSTMVFIRFVFVSQLFKVFLYVKDTNMKHVTDFFSPSFPFISCIRIGFVIHKFWV